MQQTKYASNLLNRRITTMHKLLLVFTLISALFFAVSCDNGSKFNYPNDKNSEAYQGGDADMPDSDPSDSGYEDPDATQEQPDNGYITSDDDADSTPGLSDDDTEKPSDSNQGELYGECYPNKTCNEGLECDELNNICIKEQGDTTPDGDSEEGNTELTEEERYCAKAGGTWDYFAEDDLTKCYKIVDCDPKPANTEWRGEQSYTEYYDLDSWTWTNFGQNYSTEYGDTDEARVCQFICAAGFDWNGYACTKGGYLTIGNICTGQTKCYNNEGEITCPTSESDDFYGQDAQYLSKCTPQSFSVNTPVEGQNVVIDHNTGLTWEQSPSEKTYTWDNRATHCNDLNTANYAGISNWRVPNPIELLTIVDNNTYNPATNSNFTNMPTSYDENLWTSMQFNAVPDIAFRFSPFEGSTYTCRKIEYYKVLCVSGNEMEKGVFTSQTISGEVVVNDSTTGLMWQKEYVTKTWQQALKYCEDLSYAGYTDWRLPNKNEAASLLDYDKSMTSYSDFPDMLGSYFWSSSTSYFSHTYDAWGVAFYHGYVDRNTKGNNGTVRCVR